jgi:hypothetical protein
VIESLYLAGFDGDQPGGAAGLLDRLPRFGQLDLLDTFLRDQERYGLSSDSLGRLSRLTSISFGYR